MIAWLPHGKLYNPYRTEELTLLVSGAKAGQVLSTFELLVAFHLQQGRLQLTCQFHLLLNTHHHIAPISVIT